jgi:glycosyltransferase involved in cell wall biosynthesis
MKIGIYTIAKDEAQFASRWAISTSDADYVVVADTGSTDGTQAILRDHHIATHDITIKPFRFDDARNVALALLPSDIDCVVSLDMDEIMVPGWRAILEDAFKPDTTRLTYRYVWSWINGQPNLTYMGDKITARHSHRWRHPVHEVLSPTIPEVVATTQHTLIEHHPDGSKSRGSYFDLLKLAVQEDPTDDRNAHYLAREYFYRRQYAEAIQEFQRHLSLPRALWKPERAASMSYMAKCYEGLCDASSARKWYLSATLECASRESLISAAKFLLSQNQYHAVIDLCEQAFRAPDTSSYMAERYANHEGPYDLMGVAYWHLGHPHLAVTLAERALRDSPDDPRLQANLKQMRVSLSRDRVTQDIDADCPA